MMSMTIILELMSRHIEYDCHVKKVDIQMRIDVRSSISIKHCIDAL
jgi:hypothetical protein